MKKMKDPLASLILFILYVGLVIYFPCSRPAKNEWPDESVMDKIVDREFGNFVMLPITVTEDSPYVAVRLLGLVAFFVWFFPAMVLAIPVLLIGICGSTVMSTIQGHP